MHRGIPFIFGLAACSLDEETFSERYLDEVCALKVECSEETTLKFIGFETADECVDAWGDLYAPRTDSTDDCEYDASAARQCLKSWKDASCDDLDTALAGCNEVYTGACATETTTK